MNSNRNAAPMEETLAADAVPADGTDARRLIPVWVVTWPTLPGGVRSVIVRAARTPDEAARKASTGWRRRALERSTTPGYRVAFDQEPEVWRVDRKGARRVSGPHYC